MKLPLPVYPPFVLKNNGLAPATKLDALGLGPPPPLLAGDDTWREHAAAVKAALGQAFKAVLASRAHDPTLAELFEATRAHLGDEDARRLWKGVASRGHWREARRAWNHVVRRRRGAPRKSITDRDEVLAGYADTGEKQLAIAAEIFEKQERGELPWIGKSAARIERQLREARTPEFRARLRLRRRERRRIDAALRWTLSRAARRLQLPSPLLSSNDAEPDRK